MSAATAGSEGWAKARESFSVRERRLSLDSDLEKKRGSQERGSSSVLLDILPRLLAEQRQQKRSLSELNALVGEVQEWSSLSAAQQWELESRLYETVPALASIKAAARREASALRTQAPPRLQASRTVTDPDSPRSPRSPLDSAQSRPRARSYTTSRSLRRRRDSDPTGASSPGSGMTDDADTDSEFALGRYPPWSQKAAPGVTLSYISPSAVSTGVFSPQGRRVLVRSRKLETTSICHAGSGNTLVVLHGNTSSSTSPRETSDLCQTAFDTSGEYLCTVDVENTATIYDSRTGDVVQRIDIPIEADHAEQNCNRAKRGAVQAMAFSGDAGERLIVFAGVDGVARVYNWLSGELIKNLKHHTSPITAVDFSPTGCDVIIGSKDGTCVIFCCETGDAQIFHHQHTDSVHSARFSANGDRIITASRMTSVITDVRTKTVFWKLIVPDKVGSTVISPKILSEQTEPVSTTCISIRIADEKAATAFFWQATMACLLQNQPGVPGKATTDTKGHTILHHLARYGYDDEQDGDPSLAIDGVIAAALCVQGPLSNLLSTTSFGASTNHAHRSREPVGFAGVGGLFLDMKNCTSLDARPAVLQDGGMTGRRRLSLALLKEMADFNWKTFSVMVNQKDEEGRTALSLAVDCPHEQSECVDFLLANNADPLCVDLSNRTALHFACFHAHIHTAQCLVDRFANINAEDSGCRTPLLVSTFQGSVALVIMLIKAGARSDLSDLHGWLPLSYALMPRRVSHTTTELYHQAHEYRQGVRDAYTRIPAAHRDDAHAPFAGISDPKEESRHFMTISKALLHAESDDRQGTALEMAVGRQLPLFEKTMEYYLGHSRVELVQAICDPTIDHTHDVFSDPLNQKAIDLQWRAIARPKAFFDFCTWAMFLCLACLYATISAGEFTGERYFLRRSFMNKFVTVNFDDGGSQFADIGSTEDIWAWIDNVFVAGLYPDPRLWRNQNGTFEGEPFPFDEYVGRPRMRTLEGATESCPHGERLGSIATCFSSDMARAPPGVGVGENAETDVNWRKSADQPKDSEKTQKTTGIETRSSSGSSGSRNVRSNGTRSGELTNHGYVKQRSRDVAPQPPYLWQAHSEQSYIGWTQGRANTYPDGGLVVTMPQNKTQAQALVAALKAGEWINLNTRAFIVEFVAYNPSDGAFITGRMMVEMSNSGLHLPSFHLMEFPLLSYSTWWDFARLGVELVFLVCFGIYAISEWGDATETWESRVDENCLHWKFPSKYDASTTDVQRQQMETARKDLQLELATPGVSPEVENRPGARTRWRSTSVVEKGEVARQMDKKPRMLDLLGIAEPALQRHTRCAQWCHQKMNCVVRPYFFDPLNWLDVAMLLSFGVAVILHGVQLVREATCVPHIDGQSDFESGLFSVARVYQTRMYLIGLGVFFSWVALFEYLRVNENFATMFFIIIGMMSKMTSFITILLVVLLSFTSLDFIAFGGARARSSTFLASLGANFEATLGNVDFVSAEKLDVPFGSLGIIILIIFILVCVLILLNLLIAHMTDAYAEVKETAEARWAFIQFEKLLEAEVKQEETRGVDGNSRCWFLPCRRRQGDQEEEGDTGESKYRPLGKHATGTAAKEEKTPTAAHGERDCGETKSGSFEVSSMPG